MFVAWRLKIVSRNSVIPVIIVLLAAVSLGKKINSFTSVVFSWIFAVGGTKTTVSVIMTQDFLLFKVFTPTVIVWLVSSAAADLLINTGLT